MLQLLLTDLGRGLGISRKFVYICKYENLTTSTTTYILKSGRKRKRLKDNIKEQTEWMDFATSTRAAGNRTRWIVVVVKLSVVPQWQCNDTEKSYMQ